MSYNPNIAPQNQDEFNQLITYKFNEAQAEYNIAVTEAKANAVLQWNKLSSEEKEEIPKQAYINQVVSMIESPKTKKQLIQEYSFFKTWENVTETASEPVDIVSTAIIKLNDKYYSVSEGTFVDASDTNKTNIITLSCEPTFANLKQFIAYEHSKNSAIPLLTDEVITEEKFKMLRKARIPLLEEYDAKVMQLNRLIRENSSDTTYVSKRTEWDTYANALANITTLAGAPWDGGGEETPWPNKPE